MGWLTGRFTPSSRCFRRAAGPWRPFPGSLALPESTTTTGRANGNSPPPPTNTTVKSKTAWQGSHFRFQNKSQRSNKSCAGKAAPPGGHTRQWFYIFQAHRQFENIQDYDNVEDDDDSCKNNCTCTSSNDNNLYYFNFMYFFSKAKSNRLILYYHVRFSVTIKFLTVYETATLLTLLIYLFLTMLA